MCFPLITLYLELVPHIQNIYSVIRQLEFKTITNYPPTVDFC